MNRSPQSGEDRENDPALRVCQQILRSATIVILVSFALIIVSTTVSTGPFVQVLGKALYYVIVLGVVVSLATWIFRGRLEKRLQDR